MKIKSCYFDGYKNLDDCKIEPVDRINLIYGKNAQGKTNFLEALSVFSGGVLKPKASLNLINFKKKFANLEINFFSGNELNKAKIVFGDKNKFILNGVKFKNLSEFFGNFYSVFFSPTSLLIVKGSPNVRRKFLNLAIAQIKPSFLKFYRQYEKVLNQRNKMLKYKRFDFDLLEIFTKQLAQIGTVISIYRMDYSLKISKFVSEIYGQISNNGEKLKIFYKSTIFNEMVDNVYSAEKVNIYLKKLENSIELDQKLGFTNFGVHKDDLVFEVDGLNLKHYGSQGQKKTCALALKLAQAEMLFLISKKRPVVLLDEVLSELDKFRQEYLINSLKNNQVFISCCSLPEKLFLNNQKIFIMKNGKLTANS